MVGRRIIAKTTSRTNWLTSLLRYEFFGPCLDHKYLRKNEQNLFCIDCKLGLCRHCSTSHDTLHDRLQICKYVYHDVVRLHEIQKYFDCSKIQTYKINGEKSVHLNPRQQSKDTKPSTKSKSGGTCQSCRRYLQDPPNSFCSIACKVSVGSSLNPKEKIEQTSFIAIPINEFTDLSLKESSGDSVTSNDEKGSSRSSSESSADVRIMVSSAPLKPRKRLNKRKGLPFRAPMH